MGVDAAGEGAPTNPPPSTVRWAAMTPAAASSARRVGRCDAGENQWIGDGDGRHAVSNLIAAATIQPDAPLCGPAPSTPTATPTAAPPSPRARCCADGVRRGRAMPPRRSAASAPADARNHPAVLRSPRTPLASNRPPMSASRYPSIGAAGSRSCPALRNHPRGGSPPRCNQERYARRQANRSRDDGHGVNPRPAHTCSSASCARSVRRRCRASGRRRATATPELCPPIIGERFFDLGADVHDERPVCATGSPIGRAWRTRHSAAWSPATISTGSVLRNNTPVDTSTSCGPTRRVVP